MNAFAPRRQAKNALHYETPDDFVFALKGPRFTANRRVLAEAGASIECFFTSELMALKDKLGPVNWQFMPTKKFDPEDFERFLQLLPRQFDGQMLRHTVEVRHGSFQTSEFIELAREYGVAIVLAADSDYSQITDIIAPFVYARIMGATEAEVAGYSRKAIYTWSIRTRIWAAGGPPDGLETVTTTKVDKAGRDVFLYVISGFKPRNPAAAMAIIERLK